MTKRLLILGACIAVVLATAAGPALADGQSATGSLATVQVGSASASPDTAVSAPVDVDSPVCAGAVCDNGSTSQSSTAATATGDGGAGQAPAAQSTTGSAGTVQVGATSVEPATAVAAPVTANAPVCVLAACRHGAGGQVAESKTASNKAASNRPDGAGSQSAHHSAGTVQVESVDVGPATAVSAPVDANVPVCIAAACSPGQAPGTAGHAETTNPSTGSGTTGESTNGSVGTVQVGSVDVAPATAVNAPVGANAPVCVLASCYASTHGTTTVTNEGATPPPGTGPTTGAGGGGQTVPAGTPAEQPAPAGTPAGQPAAATKAAPKGAPPTGRGVAGGKHTSTSPPGSRTARSATEVLKGTLPFTGLALATCAGLALIMVAVGTAARSVLTA